MDGLRLAGRGVIAAVRFFFWSVVEHVTKSIHWYKEAAREQLILKPRRPKDLYDAGYVLFVYDIPTGTWLGYWRTPQHTAGMASEEVYQLAPELWGNVPFHEVEFSAMPEISFQVRAVELAWCRKQMPEKYVVPEQPEARGAPLPDVSPVEAEAAAAVKH